MSLDVYLEKMVLSDVFSNNITHNLTTMAREAGIYECMWRPEELGITHARQMIPLLEAGLTKLLADPEHYEKFNPANGWGDYRGLVSFVRDYIDACKEHPDATVRACR